MRTPRLYWDNRLLLDFEATVVSIESLGKLPAIELDATAFYPEAGGQLPDRGVAQWDAGTAPVADAQDLDGRVLHALALPSGIAPPAPGTRVCIRIDANVRRDHMSQHTGQHMLSRALLDVAGAATVSSRLGETVCTIDTSLQSIAEKQLFEAEERVARAVIEDRPVRALRPTAEELSRMVLRRELKVTEDVRIVEIEGFDLNACGGTHCERTGQVGLVKIVGVERHKGGLRLSFNAGLRLLPDYALKHRVLSGLAAELTCGLEDVPGVVRKMRESATEAAREASSLRGRLASRVASELLATAPRAGGIACVSAVLEGESIEYMRALGSALAAPAEVAAILAASSKEGVQVLAVRGAAAVRFDAGAAIRRIASACGGRGGGRPERAEGRLPAGAGLKAAVAEEWKRLE